MTAGVPNIEALGADVEHSAERNLRLNTHSLILANVLAGVLGLIFWAAAARLFPAREVGVASALITSAVMLSTLSILSIDTMYERFLPLAGTRTGKLLEHGFLLVVATSALAGIALVVFGPRDPLFGSGWSMASFPILVMVLAVFTLLDKTAAGLGVARWSAAKNAFHAAAKLAVLVALAWTDVAVSIVFAWGAIAAAAAVFLWVALIRRIRSHPRFLVTPTLPPRRELWSYFRSSFGITAVWVIGPLAVPLIVITQVGAEANAYFAIAWAMISALYLTVHLVVSPFVAEVAAHPDRVASLSRRLVRTLAVVAGVGGIGLVVVGPLMLDVVGAEYRANSVGLLYLAGVFVPLSVVGAIYEGLARVRRRLTLALAVRCVSTLVIVCGSLIGARVVGVVGVGWAYLAAEAVSALVLIGPVVLWLRRSPQGSRFDKVLAIDSGGGQDE
ncbi:lipopolysaccharide biosynthesis protein [Rhodococcus marinonascens]|uniref:lipopolysaccharide biosynthesis protein n=1 Tax=Rhodococcus marinonascens TaxID=38311 RepID=UPI000AC8C5B8|nr:lipopolysaccharide biosynthesis protein [Rhodococcus marinonascens]